MEKLADLRYKSGIYQIRNVINGKTYIGSSVKIGIRWINHKSELKHNKHVNPYLQHSWNKYGDAAFVLDVLCLDVPSNLLEREKEFIDRYNPEYNISKTPQAPMRGRKHTKETIEKIKLVSKKCMTPEKNKKMLGARYKNHVYKQKKYLSKDERSRICSDAGKARWKNPEYREMMTDVRKNQITDEIKVAMSIRTASLWEDEGFRKKSIQSRRKVNKDGRGRAKHSIDDVREIRRLHWEDGLSAREITSKLNDNYHTIRTILYNSWKWVDNEK